MTFVAFDLLYLDGRSLLAETYDERRAGSKSLSLAGATFTTTESFRDVPGRDILDAAVQNGLEGVVAKRRDSPYRPGRRSPDWVKVKSFTTQEVVIGGWTEGQGRADGQPRRPAARDPRGRRPALRRQGGHRVQRDGPSRPPRRPAAPRDPQSPFAPAARPPRRRRRTSSRPSSWARSNSASGPRPAGSATRPGEACARTRRRTTSWSRVRGRNQSRHASTSSTRTTIGGRELSVSNLEKVLFPAAGFTKGQLIDYYVRIAAVMLPHLRERPLTMKRFPDGVEGNPSSRSTSRPTRPTGSQTVRVPSSDGHDGIPYAMVNDLADARLGREPRDDRVPRAAVARRAAIASSRRNPDFMVFDLDPGEGTSIVECCVVAGSSPTSSPSTALECVRQDQRVQGPAALRAGRTEDDLGQRARPCATTSPARSESEHRDLVVSNMRKSLRRGRVLIDWSQNHPAKTTVAVYSVRAMPTPTVSTPVTGAEVRTLRQEGRPGTAPLHDRRRAAPGGQAHGDLFGPLAASDVTDGGEILRTLKYPVTLRGFHTSDARGSAKPRGRA